MKTILLVSIILIVCLLMGMVIFLTTPRLCYWNKFQLADRVIQKIETYKITYNRLPSSLEEIGERVSEAGPIFYKKINNTEYEIWFGTTLGESMTYNSETQKWE